MSNYNSTHTGAELDEAIGRVIDGGSIKVQVDTNTADITDLKGRMTTAEGNITSTASELDAVEGTVTSQGTAITDLQGRMTAAEEAIENIPTGGGDLTTEKEIGLGFPIEQYYNSNGVWTATALSRQTSYVMPAELLRGETVKFTPKTGISVGARVCFLKSAPVANSSLVFCDGETGEILSAEEFSKEVPADCSHIVVRITDYVGGSIINCLPTMYELIPITEQVDALSSIRYVVDSEISFPSYILYWINNNNIYANDAKSYAIFIPAQGYRGRAVKLEPSLTWPNGMRFAFLASLNSTTNPSGTPDYCDSEPCIINSKHTEIRPVPSDCEYIYIQISNRENNVAVDCAPSSVAICDEIDDAVEKIGQSVPKNANGDFATLKAYEKSVFGLSSSLYAKDAAKRMMPDNVVPFILIAGQSNADGRCTTSDAPSWLSSANYTIPGFKMWNNSTMQFADFSVTANNGAGTANGSTSSSNQTFSFDAYFAHDFINQYGGQLFALKHTLGATPIHRMPTTGMITASWNPDINSFPSGCRPLLAELITKLKSAREWAAANGKALFPVAILWHQGETDADNNDYQYYSNDVSNVYGYLRGCFGAQNIPILTGYINEQYSAAYSQINDTLDSLAAVDDYLKVVDMTGHFTGRTGDLVHYNVSAISYMGEQMFSDYQTLNLGV